MKTSGRIGPLSARALASAVPIAMIVGTVMAPVSAMTLFQALANKVKQVDPGASTLTFYDYICLVVHVARSYRNVDRPKNNSFNVVSNKHL
jgi:hypothetical protein